MKNWILLTCLLIICFTGFAQSSYPFEVKSSGKGEQHILFIPGFGCAGEVWDETIAQLDDHYQCHVLTLAGFAGVPPSDESSFDHWVTKINDYLLANAIEKPIVIGHSMGGGMALALAARHPETVKKIIVVDALPALAALSNPNFESQENPDCTGAVNQMLALSDEDFLTMQQQAISRLTTNTDKQSTIVGWSMKSDRATFGKLYCDYSNQDLRTAIGNIQYPSLILLESYFKNFEPAIVAQYAQLSDAKLAYATKGLHFIMYDDFDWYMKQINDFL